MKAIERFFQYIEEKSIKPTVFERDNGLSNGYLATQLKRKGDLGERVLNTIVDSCTDINPIWLLTGKGEMLLQDENEVKNFSIDNQNIKRILELQKLSEEDQQRILETIDALILHSLNKK